MEQSRLISVIVPVYKVEKYLDKCVSSIVNQTYENLEIILVDDGSPDRSGEICDEWAARDKRIRVIHQENAGGGIARNVAMDVAQGDFISMIDSDDYIAPNMYEYLLSHMADDVDIVECEITKAHDDHANLDDGSSAVSTKFDVQDALRLHIADSLFCQTPPNKIYRRDVVADVRFPKGTGIDDEYWTYRVIGNARSLVHTTSVMYAYRQQSGSVMHSLDVRRRLRAVEAKVQRHKYLGDKYPELLGDSLKNLWFTCIYQGQLIFRQKASPDTQRAIAYLHTVMQKYPPNLSGCTLKEKMWLTMAKASFSVTCRLRNFVKIGL